MLKTFHVNIVDRDSVDVQYSNWGNRQPDSDTGHGCVVVAKNKEWISCPCSNSQLYFCQSQ